MPHANSVLSALDIVLFWDLPEHTFGAAIAELSGVDGGERYPY